MYQTEKNPVPNPAVQHVLPNILCYKSFLPHCLQIPAHLSAVPQYMKTNTEQQGGLICMQNLYNTVCKILQILSCEKYEIDPPQSPHSLLVHNMPLCPCPLPSFYRPTLESTQALGPQQAIVPRPRPTAQLLLTHPTVHPGSWSTTSHCAPAHFPAFWGSQLVSIYPFLPLYRTHLSGLFSFSLVPSILYSVYCTVSLQFIVCPQSSSSAMKVPKPLL